MKFYQWIAAGLMVLALTGCKTEYKGGIEVLSPLKLNVKKGANALPVGNYEAKLKVEKKNRLALEIKVKGSRNNPVVLLQLPAGREFNLNEGSFIYRASEIGQNYDIRGDLRSRVTDDDEQYAVESCSLGYRQEYRCDHSYPYGDITMDRRYEYNDRQNVRRCDWYTYEVFGHRNVRFFNRQTTYNLNFELVKPNESQASAQVRTQNTEVKRITTHVGRCY